MGLPFVSGFLAMHPGMNPFPFQATLLVHILSANLAMVMVPFTKLVHIVLFWSNRTTSELGWRFVPGGGHQVRATLGKEGQGV